jgi:hypothetical protein
MLVLALQFSKGIAGVGIVRRHRSDVTLTGHAVAVELKELVPGERDGHVVRHPQNGREDKVDRFESNGGRILRRSISGRPTHQCTNWELVRTGPDGCRPTIEQ